MKFYVVKFRREVFHEVKRRTVGSTIRTTRDWELRLHATAKLAKQDARTRCRRAQTGVLTIPHGDARYAAETRAALRQAKSEGITRSALQSIRVRSGIERSMARLAAP
jgi:hypothetical protein